MTAGALEIEEMGPVDYLMIEFPRLHVPGTGLRELIRLVDEGLIRILDLEFIRKDRAGGLPQLPLSALSVDVSFEMSAFAGASSALRGADDIRQAGELIHPG